MFIISYRNISKIDYQCNLVLNGEINSVSFIPIYLIRFRISPYIDGLVQDCSNAIANALELLQSCTKPSKATFRYQLECKASRYQESLFDDINMIYISQIVNCGAPIYLHHIVNIYHMGHCARHVPSNL